MSDTTTQTAAQADVKHEGQGAQDALIGFGLRAKNGDEAMAMWNAIAAHVENLEDVEGENQKTDAELLVLRDVLARFDAFVARSAR